MMAFWTTWSTTIGLLAAIGAQNAFVIESAILKRNAFIVAATCVLSDFVMISAGFLGLSVAIQSNPSVQRWLAWVGIAFLIYYGVFKLRDFFKTQSLDHLSKTPMSASKSISKTLAFSWLNPHVYVDTVILIPALALQFQDEKKYYAAAAGYLGVVTWFATITTVGIFSSQLFKNPKSWKALNLVTAIIMFWVAAKLYQELI
jgi:L-lysine exporter family protein LysE/ArgO